MINLPNSNYTWFPVSRQDYIPFYLNFSRLSYLLEDAHFVEMLLELKANSPAGGYRDVQTRIKSEAPKRLNFEELERSFSMLHLSPDLGREIFSPKGKRMGLQDTDKPWLMAERFYWDSAVFNLGSARHILILNTQLKGSGRNPMAIRPDQDHAWGGSYLWENLKAVSFTHTYKSLLPLGLLETIGISILKEEFLADDTDVYELNSAVIREAKSYRLAQLMSGLDARNPKSKDFHLNEVKSLLETNNIKYPESYYFQYGSLLALGIQCGNVTKENIMINGSLIDYEDCSYQGDNDSQVFQVRLHFQSQIKEEDVIQKLETARLYMSDFHHYLDALQMIQKVSNFYFSKDDQYDLKDGFLNYLKTFNENVYQNSDEYLDCIEAVAQNTPSYKEGVSYYHLGELISSDLVDFIRNHSKKKIKIEIIDTDSTVVTFDFTLPRGFWRNEALETYYKSITLKPLHHLTTPLLRLTEVSTKDKHVLSLDEALDLSSKFNHILSKNSWLLPYTFNNNKFKLNNVTSVEELDRKIKEYLQITDVIIEKYHGYLIEGEESCAKDLGKDELAEVIKSHVFILQGVSVKISNFKLAFIGICFYLKCGLD